MEEAREVGGGAGHDQNKSSPLSHSQPSRRPSADNSKSNTRNMAMHGAQVSLQTKIVDEIFRIVFTTIYIISLNVLVWT